MHREDAARSKLDSAPDAARGLAAPALRLAELARSRGALRWVIARLAAAAVERSSGGEGSGHGWERLGYVRAGDYARERLGLSGRSLHDLARVGRALRGLPRLEAALASGTLPWSKVRLLARFVGPDDEARWVALAERLTVRELERRVRAVDRGALDCDEDGHGAEPSESVQLRVGSALCFKWQRARTWAARVAGERVSPGEALEMITAEALSALPAVDASGPPPHAEPQRRLRPTEGGLAAAGACPPPAEAAESGASEAAQAEPPSFLRPLVAALGEADAFELDARLRRALRLEQRLDAQVASLLRLAGPRAVAGMAREELGMSPRKARALVRLERLGDACPELRAAWRDGALSWVQAQILIPLLIGGDEACSRPAWRVAWLEFAQGVTVRRLDEVVGRALTLREAEPRVWLELRGDPARVGSASRGPGEPSAEGGEPRAAGPEPARQTCARPTDLFEGVRLRVRAPREVARLFRTVLCSLRRAVEAETGRLPAESEAFEAMIDHALQSWGVDDPRLRGRTRAGRAFAVFERDGWRCTVPGCTSQRNLHAHHIHFRSAGGSDEPANLTTLCAAHHHRGVHAGFVRVSGRAPRALWFELGVRPGEAPLARYRSGDRVA